MEKNYQLSCSIALRYLCTITFLVSNSPIVLPSLANRIHISSSTFQSLQKHAIFIMQERGSIKVKVSLQRCPLSSPLSSIEQCDIIVCED